MADWRRPELTRFLLQFIVAQQKTPLMIIYTKGQRPFIVRLSVVHVCIAPLLCTSLSETAATVTCANMCLRGRLFWSVGVAVVLKWLPSTGCCSSSRTAPTPPKQLSQSHWQSSACVHAMSPLCQLLRQPVSAVPLASAETWSTMSTSECTRHPESSCCIRSKGGASHGGCTGMDTCSMF